MNEKIAVIFDMDGVLVENSEFHDEAWRLTCLKHGKIITNQDVRNGFGGSNKILVQNLLGIFDQKIIEKIAIEKEKLYRDIFEKSLRLPLGLMNLLNELKQKNVCMAVATSAPPENLHFVIDKLGIRNYFDALVDESQIKNCKPDPEIYILAANKLGVPISNCLVFEDSIFGIQSGKAAGMKVIGITTSFGAEQIKMADLIITSFTEISLERIKKLLSID